jgi:hypothetical protein
MQAPYSEIAKSNEESFGASTVRALDRLFGRD